MIDLECKLVIIAGYMFLFPITASGGRGKDLYSIDDKLQIFSNAEAFDSITYKSSAVWVIKFYADWCYHSKKLVPTWKKVAEQVQGTYISVLYSTL